MRGVSPSFSPDGSEPQGHEARMVREGSAAVIAGEGACATP